MAKRPPVKERAVKHHLREMAGGALFRCKDEERSRYAGSTDGHVRLGDDPAGAVMALKKLCRGQRTERLAGFLAA